MNISPLKLAALAVFFGFFGGMLFYAAREMVGHGWWLLSHRRIRLHRPLCWIWRDDGWDLHNGIRHWGFWFTEPEP